MSQKSWVLEQLRERGRVSRNDALANHITRLAALIANLRQEGWSLEGKWVYGFNGIAPTKDYIYKVKQ